MALRHKIYTVHVNPQQAEPDERLALVPEGFSWMAMVFTALWLLANRLVAEALAYMAVLGLLLYAAEVYGLSRGHVALIELFGAVMLGFVAHDLKRAALARRGWQLEQVVVAENELGAARRYYDAVA